MEQGTLLRVKDVVKRVGLSRATIRRLEKKGIFPKRRRLGSRSVGWLEVEIREWVQNRPKVSDKPYG